MRKMTKQNLEAAFADESQAHMRYLIFSEKAEKEGQENLQECINGETYEGEEMYPAYNKVAELQEESGVVRSTHYALEAEKIHAVMYEKAKQAAEAGEDIEIGEVSICPVCGYTVEGEAPEFCPVYGAARDSFRRF